MKKASKQFEQMEALVQTRQNEICTALEQMDSQSFKTDTWQRDGGGGGNTRVLQGDIFEKAGVNTSSVFGEVTEKEAPMFDQLLRKVNSNITSVSRPHFFATGVSLVIHPKNPFVPTVHANYRYFEIKNDTDQCWWFGGGTDLTPYYLFEDDARHFHTVQKNACDRYKSGAYNTFKQACDEYFFIPHRNETRGIGGVFYDYLNEDFDSLFAFSADISNEFLSSYVPIVEKRQNMDYNGDHKKWQQIRRGRYAEFNLVYDRGTLFGLKTGGRIESVLMSMPPVAQWHYEYIPKDGSKEAKIQAILKQPKDWI